MKQTLCRILLIALFPLLCGAQGMERSKEIHIGLNYAKTGSYAAQGLDMLRAAEMAMSEINSRGGILGKRIGLFMRNDESDVLISDRNVKDLIDIHDCQMIIGGGSSDAVIAGGKAAKNRGKVFFAALTYSNTTTGEHGHRYMFRECYNAWMGAKAVSSYLKNAYPGRRYFYITADYTWGWSTEDSIRTMTGTEDRGSHKGTLTPFPGASIADFNQALLLAKAMNPEVLVLVLFGREMSQALKQADAMGLKEKMAIVVPNLTLSMAEDAGPAAMEHVIGAVPWCWQVPYVYNHEKGKRFVERFTKRYATYPSSSAASTYTIMYEYKSAVERAGTFDAKRVIECLEGHSFALLKDTQVWRPMDHQCVQTVYAVVGKPKEEVVKDKLGQDFFKIISRMSGDEAALTRQEWEQCRKAANVPLDLEW